MNYKMLGRIVGMILILEVVLMIPAFLIACAEGDARPIHGFACAMLIGILAGILLIAISKKAKKKFYAKEGMVCVGLCWVAMSLVGALPFFLSGRVPNYMDAFFEIVSGFTTTGASVISDVEALGKGLLFWRSFSHWIGGMGVLVFFLAIVPISGNNEGFTLHILRAESPGPSVNKMVPRMKQSAMILYIMYCVLTVADIICLLIAGMPVFDAFCIAFGTAGTGGFAVLNSGLASYSVFAQNVTTVFMLLFGVNFGVYYLIVLKNFIGIIQDEELRLYAAIVVCAIVVIALNVVGKTADTMTLGTSFQQSAFQVASIITTTGFSTTDFDLWPSLSKSILMILMMVGACAGSTGGGLKVVRLLLLGKGIKRNSHQIFHTKEVQVIRFNGARVSEQTMSNVNAYFAAYVIIIVLSFLLVSADRGNFSMTTNFSAVMATFNNIGPGFDAVGPTRNFVEYTVFSKAILSLDMLLGRLEIFPMLALFMPSTYQRK